MIKKLFILLFSISSYTYAQVDSTRMNAPTDAGGIGYKISAPELNGRSIDGFRIFKFLGGSDTVRRIMNVIYAQYAGVFGDGTDMTTRTNNMYGQPYVNSVTFAYDTTTAITFTGTVNVTKTTRVEKGVSFIGGTFNFNGNIMDADPDQIIFSPTTTVTNIRSKLGYIPAKWFGVTANGTTNDYAALTKAIAATPADLQVGLPQGKTMVGSTLNISKSIIGLGANKSSSLIYNTAASGTDLQLGNITSDSVKISNILFSGSNKCRIGVIVNNNVKGVEVAYCTFRDVEQQGSELNNSAGLVIQNGGEGIWIHHNYFTAINAKNNGISRGIWGAGSGISPKKVIVENNIFDGISNIGSASLDADQLVVQGYTDSAGMIIRNNDHYNIYKRGVKLQCAGMIVQGDRFWSTAYRSGIVANSAISLYAKQTQALGNFVYDGAYEAGAIEAGTGDGTSTQDVTIRFNYINSGTSGSQPARRGVVVYGTNNKSIAVDYNTIYNGDLGISMPGNGRGISVIGNKIYNTSDNSIKIRPANSYPNNWNYGVQMIGNYVFKCGQAAYAIGNINGGSFIGNMIDSCSDDFILNYAPYIDSLIGFTAIGNTSSPFGYGSGKRVNFGNYSQRLPFANAASCPGLQYVAADSSNATYLYQGGAYVKIGTSTSGNAILQGGNSFGAAMAIGTNDNNDILIRTNNSVKYKIGASGYIYAGSGDIYGYFYLGNSTQGGLYGRNVADGYTAFTINNGNASATGNVTDFQFNGSTVAYVNKFGHFWGAGGFIGPTFFNGNGNDASYTWHPSSGALITRNIADANPILYIRQSNGSGTGKFISFLKQTTELAYIGSLGDLWLKDKLSIGNVGIGNSGVDSLLVQDASTKEVRRISPNFYTKASDASSNSYTPTSTVGTNVSSVTSNYVQYFKIGNYVFVNGMVLLTVTTSGIQSKITMTIPLSSDFTTSVDAMGNGNNNCVIYARPANDDIEFIFYPVSTGSQSLYFNYSYYIGGGT